MSFANIKKLARAAAARNENRLRFFPRVIIESNLLRFPTGARVTYRGFGQLVYPICSEMQLGDVLHSTIFDQQVTQELVEGWLDKFYQCSCCGTQVPYKLPPASTPGNDNREWCALNIRRPAGRLYSHWSVNGFHKPLH